MSASELRNVHRYLNSRFILQHHTHAHTQLYTKVLNVPEELSGGIFRMLSAILWIGNLEFTDTESEACQLTQADLQVVRKIGKLLGLPEAQVRKVCTIRQINVKGTTTDIALKFHEVRGGVGTNKLCIVHNPMYCTLLGWFIL